MQDNAENKADFAGLISDVLDFYGKDTSKFALRVWWDSLKPYDLEAINRACGLHARQSEFAPKPSNIVRLIEGSSGDKAMEAWAKLERAIRRVGGYKSVVFEDALIHAVVSDMGGWSYLCQMQEKEMPFRAKEFENKYRSLTDRAIRPEYPQKLVGIHEAENTNNGFKSQAPVLIGNPEKCKQVLIGGTDKPILQITQMSDAMDKALVGLMDMSEEAEA